MSRPDDIPQDVWDAAERAYVHDDYFEQVEMTARAILAERERCAKVAEILPKCAMTNSHNATPEFTFSIGAAAQASAIAAAIRGAR
jgi:hypothetical protein